MFRTHSCAHDLAFVKSNILFHLAIFSHSYIHTTRAHNRATDLYIHACEFAMYTLPAFARCVCACAFAWVYRVKCISLLIHYTERWEHMSAPCYILYLYPPGPVVCECLCILYVFFIFTFFHCSCFFEHIFLLSSLLFFFVVVFFRSHSHT